MLKPTEFVKNQTFFFQYNMLLDTYRLKYQLDGLIVQLNLSKGFAAIGNLMCVIKEMQSRL